MTAHASAAVNTVSVTYLRALFDHVESRGLATATLLGGFRIDPTDRESRVTESLCADLFDRASALLADDALGLHAGEQIRPGHYGVLGYVAMNCSTLAEALSSLGRYQALVVDVGPVGVGSEDGELVLSWNPQVERPYRQLAEFNFAGLLSFARWISGRPGAPLRMDFTYPEPADLTEHQRVLGGKFRFGQDCYRMLLPRDWLQAPLIQPDPAMRELMLRLAEQQILSLAKTGDDLLTRARHFIAGHLSRSEVELETVAKHLGMAGRSLQRKLAEAGLGYTQLIDEVRRELAERYLAQPELGLVDIAFLLGYSEQSAFNRAYRRWTGRTPAMSRA